MATSSANGAVASASPVPQMSGAWSASSVDHAGGPDPVSGSFHTPEVARSQSGVSHVGASDCTSVVHAESVKVSPRSATSIGGASSGVHGRSTVSGAASTTVGESKPTKSVVATSPTDPVGGMAKGWSSTSS